MPSQINSPAGVFLTPNGEIFFIDRGNYRVRKILRTGETVTIAGTGVGGYNEMVNQQHKHTWMDHHLFSFHHEMKFTFRKPPVIAFERF